MKYPCTKLTPGDPYSIPRGQFDVTDGPTLRHGGPPGDLMQDSDELSGQGPKGSPPRPPISFELIAEHSPSPMALIDASGRYRFINAKFRELFGFSPGELPTGREWFVHAFPDDEERRQAIEAWKEDMEREEPVEPSPRIFRVRCRDGTDRHILFRPVALGDGDRLIIYEDQTSIVHHHEALETVNRRLMEIIEFLPDPTFVIDRDGEVIAWNRAMEDLTGVKKEEMLGRKDRAYSVPFYGDVRRPLLADLVLRETDEGLEAYSSVERRDGTLVAETFIPSWNNGRGAHLWGKASLLLTPNGTVAGAIESIRDITAWKETEERLRRSETRYRTLVESINDIIYAIDAGGRITYISPVVSHVSGHRPEDLIGHQYLELVHPDDRARVQARLGAILAGENGPSEFRMVSASGEVRWVRTFTRPIVVDGQVVELRGVLSDITDLKQQEVAVRRSEALLARMADLSPFGYYVVDCRTDRVLYSNDRFCRLWGEEDLCRDLRREEFRNRDLVARVAPLADDPGAFIASCSPLQGEGDRAEVMDEVRLRDGRVLWRYSTPIPGDEERSSGRLYLFKDVTDERRQVEELRRYRDELEGLVRERTDELTRANANLRREMAVRELATRQQLYSEQRFIRIFDQAPIGMAIVSLESRFLRVNAALCRLTGYTREELLTLGPYDITHPDDVSTGLELTESLASGDREDYARDKRYLQKDGSTVCVHMTIGVVRDASGRPLHLFSMAEDITAQKKAGEQLRVYADALRESNEDLQRFAYVASHDLQEPLRSIVSFSQLLERRLAGDKDADVRDFLGFIVEGGVRMQALIQNLLVFSRVTTAGQPFQPTDAASVVADVLRDHRAAIAESGAVVTVGPLPVVRSDPSQLHQVFTNLVGNAIKYRGGHPPEIGISAERVDGCWRFAIADNGIGIEPEYHDRVFELFQRLHTKEEYAGTGIGLAVVRRIIERHGGSIRVESSPGEGSTFFFTLPAA